MTWHDWSIHAQSSSEVSKLNWDLISALIIDGTYEKHQNQPVTNLRSLKVALYACLSTKESKITFHAHSSSKLSYYAHF
jgi:hypothetical protein